ncbi:hypothetical protein KCP91_15055 [Microvirga sp. SRT01]|jgi:hypothetical protein|uniref:Uncharacterized protein n=1 Tax=Sphingomonas longa TaxID=2778730 RepID=A0ABS2D9U2_9SPHN|nr:MULTISPECIES: hypothetical protein [Alphaproteobacteria]MBM6577700.1 hypothetical protein [Sphingomonas sp. BT552]MBR7710742.1 hypothetical protein [Microvirga sp. SRT01]
MAISSQTCRDMADADRAAAAQESLPKARQLLLQSAERWEEMAERARQHEEMMRGDV